MPYDDNFTIYLLTQKRLDGSVGAYLRNPERNIGVFLDADHIVREGNAVELIGKLNGKPNSLLANGVYDPDQKRLSIVLVRRGDTFDFWRDTDEDSSFYPRGVHPARYVYRPPLARADGWPVGTLEGVNIDRSGIEKFIQMIIDMPMETVHTPYIEGVLIARHGKLVLEEYFHGFSRDRLHDTRSAGKSVTATLVGAAMHSGVPLKLSTPVYQLMNGGAFPSDIEPRKRAMTLEHLLTMRSGYFCDDSDPNAPGNEDGMQDQTDEPDYYRFTMRVPMAYEPDTVSVYCSANPNLALGMVGRATGESPLDTFDRLLGRPMNIQRYAWPLDPIGHPYGGGGVKFLPRDFMKFGQLMLNGGTWYGRRILSREFAERASAPLHDLRRIQYGYLWWSIEYPYKDRTVRAYFAGGNGGQGVIVVPELDLVVAIYAGNYSDRMTIHIQQELPASYILPAVREPGDDPNVPVSERNFSSPYGKMPLPPPH